MSNATDPSEHVPALRAAALGMQAAGLDPYNDVSWRLTALADAIESGKLVAWPIRWALPDYGPEPQVFTVRLQYPAPRPGDYCAP